MSKRFKTYYNEDLNEEVEFTVFIIHGHSKELSKLEGYINDELRFNTIILQNDFSGMHILDKFKNAVWEDADCAIALMSPDDKLESGNYRARQNVFYELGYCQGFFDAEYEDKDYNFEPVTVIKEKSINFQDASDLLGLDSLEYNEGNLETVFLKLGKHLKKIYNEVSGKEMLR